MPIANADLSSQITFNLGTGYFNIEDTTDYASFGITSPPATAKVWYEITFPSGSTYQGDVLTPDIANSLASNTWNTLLIPVDANGVWLEGNYVFTQYVNITGDGGGNNGTYSLQIASIDFCDERPSASVITDVNCVTGVVTIKDKTTYDPDWTESARTFTATSSNNSTQSTSGSLIQFSYPDFYSGTYIWTIDVQITRDYGDYIVTGPLQTSAGINPASGYFDVQCADWCSVYCCIKEQDDLLTSYIQQYGWGNPKTETLAQKLFYVGFKLNLIAGAQQCSEPQDIAGFTESIRKLLNCTGDCGCGDGVPRLITPIAVAAATYNFLAGTRLDVTVAGSNVTYSIDANTDAKITALYNAVVESNAGTGEIALLVTPTTTAGNPDVITYNVRLDGSYIVEYSSSQACIATVTWGGGPIVNTSRKTVYGTHFDNAANIVPLYFNGATFTEVQPLNWASLPAMFKVKEFNNTSPNGTNNWKGQVDIVGTTLNAPPPAISTNPVPQIYLQYHDAAPENDYWYILMVDMYGTGAPTFGALQSLWSEFQLQITIES